MHAGRRQTWLRAEGVCRQFFEAKHAELEEQLFAAHRNAFPPHSHELDDFLWAVATVRSRVHSPLDGEDVALVPLADLVCPPSPLLKPINAADAYLFLESGEPTEW
jgi:hypothetical protein